MSSNNWTREQTIIAFNLYCKIPFSKAVQGNPQVIEIANLINRTPSAVAMKLGNFGRLDPDLRARGIGGLKNGSKLEEVIWNEFHHDWEQLAYESERLLSEFKEQPIEMSAEIEEYIFPLGTERDAFVRNRVNQAFFRKLVLSSYDQTCCITGLHIPELLIASHIKPWKDDTQNRLNPKNGLCLNALHDKAFDRGLLTITPDYRIHISNQLKCTDEIMNAYFQKYHQQVISLPQRYHPDKEFLQYHNDVIFVDR